MGERNQGVLVDAPSDWDDDEGNGGVLQTGYGRSPVLLHRQHRVQVLFE